MKNNTYLQESQEFFTKVINGINGINGEGRPSSPSGLRRNMNKSDGKSSYKKPSIWSTLVIYKICLCKSIVNLIILFFKMNDF